MLTEQERDEILLSLKTDMGYVKTYLQAIAAKLLAPEEIAEIESEVDALKERQVPA